MKNFIMSFINPKKMIVHRDMNIFIAILIFISCIALAIGSSNLMSSNYVRKQHEELLIYHELSEVKDLSEMELFKVKTQIPENGLFKEIVYDEEIDGKTIERSTTLEGGTVLNVKIIYDLNYYFDEGIKLNFDLEDYYREEPKEKVKDLLFIISKRYLIYVHNHGRFEEGEIYYNRALEGKSVYQTNSDGSIKYFLPSNLEEASGSKTYWTKEVDINTLKDQSDNYYVEIDEERYLAVPHLDWSNKEHLAVQNNLYLDYMFLTDNGFSLNGFKGTFTDLARGWYDFSVHIHASALKTANLINAILLMFLMPLLWILVTWLMSKRYGELTLFREYYIISAVTMILPSLLSFIVGFFIPYYFIAKYLMFVQIAFYIFSVFRINSSVIRNQDRLNNPTNKKLPEKLITKSINDVEDNKANQIG